MNDSVPKDVMQPEKASAPRSVSDPCAKSAPIMETNGMAHILITPEKQAEIGAAIEEARANVISWDKIRDIAMADPKPTLMLADRVGQRGPPTSIGITFEGGVTAAISFEEQPAGIFRHLSVSTRDGRQVLNPTMFALIAREFGIDIPLTKPGRGWVEEYEPGRFAINVVVLEAEREAGHA